MNLKNNTKIFVLCIISSVLVNIDHGIIPASTSQIKRELNVNSLFIGLLGSLVFIGLMLGSVLSGYLYSKYQCKLIVIISLIGNGGFSIIFGIFPFLTTMLISRFFIGIFQMLLIVYFPVWVDTFGENKKTIWLSYLQISVVLGVVIGFIITGLFNYLNTMITIINWRLGFYIQGIVMFIISYFIYHTNQIHLNTNGIIYDNNDLKQSFINFKSIPMLDPNIFKNNLSAKNSSLSDIVPEDINNEEYNQIIKADEFKKKNIIQKVIIIFKNRVFIGCILILSSLIYIVTVIQFWISDYIIYNFKLSSYKTTLLFSIISVTGPGLGLYSGGLFFTKIGGYASIESSKYILIILGITFCIALILPFITNLIVFLVLLWFSLFFGASIISSTMGYMLFSFQHYMKNLVMSLYQFFTNLMAYIPAPSIYGILAKHFGDKYALFYTVIYGIIMATLGSYIIYNNNKKQFIIIDIKNKLHDINNKIYYYNNKLSKNNNILINSHEDINTKLELLIKKKMELELLLD